MERVKIEDALLKIGFRVEHIGFTYVADAIQILDKKGGSAAITKDVYPEIAEKRGATWAQVERNIRYSFLTARRYGDVDLIYHYLGIRQTNSACLTQLYMMLKREDEE